MSGGVDSSVAAYLLCSQGYECGGITMKLFGNEMISLSGEHTCCSERDTEDARKVARGWECRFIYTISLLFSGRMSSTVLCGLMNRDRPLIPVSTVIVT